MSSVTLKNVYKKWDNAVTAVTDFNLDVKDGEVIVLVGPSGCGKSNTLYMIAGIENISEGELYIDGKLMNNVEPKDRGISMVFQNYALFPHMTVYENIAFGLQPTDMPENEIKEKVEEIARITDVIHLFHRKPHELSAGQKQRVAMCRSLIKEHKIILLDEPLSNLDVRLRASMRIELMKIHQKFKTTFIYVTHDQNEALAMADRIVAMRNGFTEQIGTPEELYSHPVNMFVAGFLGTPMMNFWNTKVVEENGDIFIDLNGVKIKLPENKADKCRGDYQSPAYIGKEVYAGIRPEDMYAVEMIDKMPPMPHLAFIDANVQVKEFLGDRSYLYCEYGDIPFTVRVLDLGDLAAKNGDKIKVGLHRDKIYLFDKETELAIVN